MHIAPNPALPFPAAMPRLRTVLRHAALSARFGVTAAALLYALGPGPASALRLPQDHAEAIAEVAPAPAESGLSRRTRCAGCGTVVSIERVGAADVVPAAYEFTVRMRDGSVRRSSVASPGSWLVGDRIILIGGTAPAAD